MKKMGSETERGSNESALQIQCLLQDVCVRVCVYTWLRGIWENITLRQPPCSARSVRESVAWNHNSTLAE